MAILVDCAFCHSRVRAPDAMAGREAECPKCGVVLSIPPQVEVEAEGRLDAMDVEVAKSPAPAATSPVRDHADGVSDEPWPYRFIDGYSTSAMILGGVFCCLGWAATMMYVGKTARDDTTILMAFIGASVAWLVVFLGIAFNCALVRLCLDAARNLRAIRRRLADGGRPGDAPHYS